jgi:hypothetical protein
VAHQLTVDLKPDHPSNSPSLLKFKIRSSTFQFQFESLTSLVAPARQLLVTVCVVVGHHFSILLCIYHSFTINMQQRNKCLLVSPLTQNTSLVMCS